MSEAACFKCRAAPRRIKNYTPQERDILLTRTGLILGWRDGQPVIAALLLPRCGVQHFAGMSEPAFVFWDQPAYRCPWADPEGEPAILAHGPAVFAPDGRALIPMNLDDQGCWPKATHCALGRPGRYFIKPFVDPALPRRRIDSR